MATTCRPQVTFEFYDKLKPVVARFDQAHASTDGGVVLLKALDDQLRVTEQLAACLVDRQDPDTIRHTVRDLLRQRVFGLACGYEDGNDAARLAHDPLHKLAVGRDPVTGAALASQPILSRFESVVGLAGNPRLARRAGRLLGEAYGLSQFSGRTEQVFGETLYAARSWSQRRRVIIKAEVVRLPGRDPRCNPRLVVTNLHETPAAG